MGVVEPVQMSLVYAFAEPARTSESSSAFVRFTGRGLSDDVDRMEHRLLDVRRCHGSFF